MYPPYRLSYSFKCVPFKLVTLTDEYYFLDTVYHIVKEVLAYPPLTMIHAYHKIDLELYEYLDSVIAWEDRDMLNEIVECVYQMVVSILSSELFEPLLSYDGEILDVQYRYEPRERYVKYYILFQDK